MPLQDSFAGSAGLYVDVDAMTRLAARCVAATGALPGPGDPDVIRFVQMARRVDPRPMLLDEEFELRLRFDLFARIVEPLCELARRYGVGVERQRLRDDRLTVYLDVLAFTVRTLCAGLELFAAVQRSAQGGNPAVLDTIVAASRLYDLQLSALLERFAQLLDQSDLLRGDEATTLANSIAHARQCLARTLADRVPGAAHPSDSRAP